MGKDVHDRDAILADELIKLCGDDQALADGSRRAAATPAARRVRLTLLILAGIARRHSRASVAAV